MPDDNQDPLDPFALFAPPITVWWDGGKNSVAGPGSIPAFKDSSIGWAVTTLAGKLASFNADPGLGPIALSTARDLAAVVRHLSSLGA
jgi:hypothetical protein